MAKTFDENAADDLRQVLAYLVVRWNCTDSYLAKKIDCSEKTIRTIRGGSLSCSSRFTERIRRYAKLERKKQEEEEAADIRRLL